MMAREARDITGQRFGRLVGVCPTDKRSFGTTVWVLRCDCGSLIERPLYLVMQGNTKSCGCLRSESTTKRNMVHGDACVSKKALLYSIWLGMRARCRNPNHTVYAHYGGRGIKVCKEWRSSYIVFRAWAMVNGYENGLQIHRIDPDGHYEPNNCRWLSKSSHMKLHGGRKKKEK